METAAVMESPICERLWEEYADALLLFSATILSDRGAAEDAVQAVFARLLSTRQLPAIESEAAYLFRSVRNESLNATRSRRRRDKTEGRFLDFAAADPREEAELSELRRTVEASLFELPPEQREAAQEELLRMGPPGSAL